MDQTRIHEEDFTGTKQPEKKTNISNKTSLMQACKGQPVIVGVTSSLCLCVRGVLLLLVSSCRDKTAKKNKPTVKSACHASGFPFSSQASKTPEAHSRPSQARVLFVQLHPFPSVGL